MKLQLAQLKRMKFGRSSEQLDAQIAQLELSLEELEANAAEAPIAATPTTPISISTKPMRQALPADLPRESHRHEPNTGACNCPQCGGTLRELCQLQLHLLDQQIAGLHADAGRLLYKVIGAVDFLCFISAFRADISWLSPDNTEISIQLASYYAGLANMRDTAKQLERSLMA